MKWKSVHSEEIERAALGIEPDIKKSVLLSGSWDGNYAVAVVVVDHVKPKAEVHEKATDIWRVLKGKGKFVLGGKLVSPEMVRAGEFVADMIEGGEIIEVSEGDVIDIPSGVPHQINPEGARLELLIIKINQ